MAHSGEHMVVVLRISVNSQIDHGFKSS